MEKENVDERKRLLHQVEVDDLIKFGMIPEFLGRLPVIAILDPLDSDDLVRILTEPKDAIVKHQHPKGSGSRSMRRFRYCATPQVANFKQALNRP